ncbi:hypothetical protein SAMN05216551_109240 [Chitinasiproducens palmae]|uniref:Uncharacterized protein n=1 Tax=Chitinasiproducens palmae TaxID=1770053 RepID=A0A1H2PTC0_9BURK|nr:hypothetical protein SAMN05216551_109240 [Chitinasiproducens palmae]
MHLTREAGAQGKLTVLGSLRRQALSESAEKKAACIDS